MENFFPFPKDISMWGHHVDDLFWTTVYLTGIATVLVVGILFYFLIVYREREGHRAVYSHGDQKIHMMVTGGLSLLVFVGLDFQLESRSRRAFDDYLKSYPNGAGVVRIEVRAEQFTWKVRYPGPDGKFKTTDDVWDPVFAIPAGAKVAVEMTSKDVIHSFFLPNVRIKQDAVPGIVTSMWFETKAGTEGDYEVACAELCGNGHTRMRVPFKVMSPAEFDKHLTALYADDANVGEEEDINWGWEWKGR